MDRSAGWSAPARPETPDLTIPTQSHGSMTFEGVGGVSLFRQVWRPAGAVRAVLINLHGLGDHSGLYPTLVEHFQGRGITVHAMDLRGNGRSGGQRAYVERWDEFREDLRRFVELVRAEEAARPLFLLGNSLGGLIVLDDMLHPGYPTLVVAVLDYLQRHPEMTVLSVIDRESVTAAAKFVLCEQDWFKRYEAVLLEDYKANIWPMGATFEGANFEPHWCLVLSLDTELPDLD